MLTTATVLMSPNAEPGNVRHVSSDQADSAGISFAKSFGEGIDLADAVPIQGADNRNLKDAVEKPAPTKSVDVASVLSGTKLKVNTGAGDKLQSKFSAAKGMIPSRSEKSIHSLSSGVRTVTTTGGIHSNNGEKENISTIVQVGAPGKQFSSGDVKDAAQRSTSETSETTDVVKSDVVGPVVVFGMDAAAPALFSIPETDEKLLIQNQKETLIAVKNQGTFPIQKMTTAHDGVVKTEKEKTEEKTKEVAETIGNTIGSGVPAVVAVPVTCLPVEGKQHGLSTTPDEDAPSSVASAVSGRSGGMTAGTQTKAEKKAAIVKKPNGDDMKTTVSALADDSASRKTEVDAAKAPEDGNVKSQNVTSGIMPAGLTHAVPATAPGALAVGVAAANAVAATPQTTDTNSHIAIMQAGSGAIDTTNPVDATHRTLIATPTTLEVGVTNGTHGWLKIRAEMTGGGVVNASLSTATSTGQEMLHRELPSLTAYLQSERVAVNTVVVQATAGADSGQLAGGMNRDGRGEAQQSGGHGGENRQNTASTVLNRAQESMPYNGLSGVEGDELLSPMSYAGGGSWLSVRA